MTGPRGRNVTEHMHRCYSYGAYSFLANNTKEPYFRLILSKVSLMLERNCSRPSELERML